KRFAHAVRSHWGIENTCHMPRNVVPWLYRVVRNRAISAARSADRRKRHERAAAENSRWFVDENSSTETAGLDAQTAAEALQALPIEQREIIVAHLWGGLSFIEIAEVLGTSSSTAHRRYAAGLETLRERLDVKCPPN
ncbi:MAG: sigma-70 family RNA polymerase sigma factor, partial [Planctomycetaceae bacterium]